MKNRPIIVYRGVDDFQSFDTVLMCKYLSCEHLRIGAERGLYCGPALDLDHTASNSDQLVTQQAIGRVETLPRIPWSGLPADMISNLVNQGCQFTVEHSIRSTRGAKLPI